MRCCLRLPFDYYILQLRKLYISYRQEYAFENCGNISWDSTLLANTYAGIKNVPRSLVVITDLMAEVEKLIGEKQSNLRPLVTQRLQLRKPELYKVEREKLINLLSVIPRENCDFIETTPEALRSAVKNDLDPTLKEPKKEIEKKTRKILALLLSNNGTSIYFDKKSTTASEKIIVPSKYKSPQWEKTLNKVIDSLSQNESDAIDFTLAKLEDTIKCD